jgi:hypothetical protein
MADIDTQLLKEIKTRRIYTKKIGELETELSKVTDDLNYATHSKKQKIDDARELYIDSEREKVTSKYAEQLDVLTEDIRDLKEQIDHKGIDETEELREARRTQEYLNEAALKIESYHSILQSSSSAYLIDLAYNEEVMSMNKFKKAYKTIDSRCDKISNLDEGSKLPFRWEESVRERFGNANISIYLLSILASPLILLTIPVSVGASIKRAKYIHSCNALYHSFMHTLFQLRDNTNEEIQIMLGSLIRLKSEALNRKLFKKEEELNALQEQIEKELDGVEFSEEEFVASLDRNIGMLTLRKTSLEADLQQERERFEVIEARINELLKIKEGHLAIERQQYMLAREDRLVVLPEQLLYDYDAQSNKWFDLTPGLYLYRDREDVDNLLQSSIFQLRNIMQWGTLQFRILDLFGADFVSPLRLSNSGSAKAQDINVFTLQEERESTLELAHDLLERRKQQVLTAALDIGDYNILQKENGSSPLPYQMIYLITNEQVRLDERLKQLSYSGAKVGLNTYVFMKEELVDLSFVKTVQDYFSKIVEVTNSGLTSYSPTSYRAKLEEEEEERQRR